jgi:serine/threonine protein kinase
LRFEIRNLKFENLGFKIRNPKSQMQMTHEKWQRVKEIFHGAFELPDAERARYISSECGDDPFMLGEVRSLLASHSEARSLFEAPALAAVSDLIEDSAPSRAGQIIGSYRLESEIGRGGMGAVYLASRADEAYDKKVAIKLIKRGFDTDEIVRRFRYERQILASLDHPNITRLHRWRLDRPTASLTSSWILFSGEPLNRFSDERKLSVRQRLELFLQICSAVSYAHRSLVIHRDLKPSNILVTPDGAPKLLDFGIAKITSAGAEGDQTQDRTIAAFHALTPEYASPEQIAGLPVTTASDIYSLGVILYELLTGRRPYSFETRTAREVSEVLAELSITKPSTACRVRSADVEKGRFGKPSPSAPRRSRQYRPDGDAERTRPPVFVGRAIFGRHPPASGGNARPRPSRHHRISSLEIRHAQQGKRRGRSRDRSLADCRTDRSVTAGEDRRTPARSCPERGA